jgi:hypothetical protein
VVRVPKRLTPTGVGKSAFPWRLTNGLATLNELTTEPANQQVSRPATAPGWTWTWQRCGRYEYRKCLTHLTNPDHLVASVPSPTNVPPLRIAARYLAGRKHG